MGSAPRLLGLVLVLAACTASAQDPASGPQVKRMLADARYDWITLETEHTRIHVPAGSYAETKASQLRVRAERARQVVLDRLSVPEYDDLLHLFYVDSRADMANLTGSPVTGYSYFGDHAVVVVLNAGWRAFETHELTHVVTLETWSDPAGPAVVEGLATYVDGACGGYENGRIVRAFLDRGSLIPLGVLTDEFRQQNDLIAYLEAATVIEFVMDRGGYETMKVLWARGLGASPILLGMSPAVFQREFEAWLLETYAPISPTAFEAIRAGGCGIDDGGQASNVTPAHAVSPDLAAAARENLEDGQLDDR